MITPASKKPSTQAKIPLQPWTLPVTTWGWYTNLPGLTELAEGFAPISLQEMESVALLNRTDTKFVMSSAQILTTLSALQKDYRMLAVCGQRLNHYRTLYFDTPSFELYHQHVNGRLDRYKVRSREYIDSNLSFLEVKHKTSKGRTIKSRLRTEQQVVTLAQGDGHWLSGVFPYNNRNLEPTLWNTFTRLTLVSKYCCERVTLDIDLTFYTEEKVIPVDGIAIAEVKMEASSRTSTFLQEMRLQKVYPRAFSKYTTGVALLYDLVKKNSLKPRLLRLEKISRGVV
jgi:hypothetical protein